ncbi:MAG: TetR/AcrR family transcriptional regulator [Patulibacter sp.]|nr:TetR/AcrR family transcriptional regulator [Patulibacter sp.]
MAVRPRSPRGEGERLRATLLDVATEMLAEVNDIDRLSIRAVTARAGVSPSALYMHFADKDELVDAIKQRCFNALREWVADAGADAGDPRARLFAMGKAYLAFAREQPGWYAVCFQTRFGELREDNLPPARDTEDADALVFLDLMDAVGAVIEASEEELFEISTVIWTALHGRASLLQAMPVCPLPDEDRWLARLALVLIGPEPGGAGGL